ncbi:hypothetical protein B0H11DRAFT_2356753 [Mycena galericulata]|nr:hypothetical protein B0H11DRAFT_2356753 [Mycena galericulata]
MPDANPDKFWENFAFGLCQIPTILPKIRPRPVSNPDKNLRLATTSSPEAPYHGQRFRSKRPLEAKIPVISVIPDNFWLILAPRPVPIPTNFGNFLDPSPDKLGLGGIRPQGGYSGVLANAAPGVDAKGEKGREFERLIWHRVSQLQATPSACGSIRDSCLANIPAHTSRDHGKHHKGCYELWSACKGPSSSKRQILASYFISPTWRDKCIDSGGVDWQSTRRRPAPKEMLARTKRRVSAFSDASEPPLYGLSSSDASAHARARFASVIRSRVGYSRAIQGRESRNLLPLLGVRKKKGRAAVSGVGRSSNSG